MDLHCPRHSALLSIINTNTVPVTGKAKGSPAPKRKRMTMVPVNTGTRILFFGDRTNPTRLCRIEACVWKYRQGGRYLLYKLLVPRISKIIQKITIAGMSCRRRRCILLICIPCLDGRMVEIFAFRFMDRLSYLFHVIPLFFRGL